MTPTEFFSLRLEALHIAADREFRGSLVPIPELPALPGVYLPPVNPTRLVPASRIQREPISHKEANRQWRLRKRLKAGGWSIPAGAQIPVARGMGTVLGLVAPGDDPMAYVPVGTPVGRLTGCRVHEPSHVARYALAVEINGKTNYLFPKAALLEREYRAMRLAS